MKRAFNQICEQWTMLVLNTTQLKCIHRIHKIHEFSEILAIFKDFSIFWQLKTNPEIFAYCAHLGFVSVIWFTIALDLLAENSVQWHETYKQSAKFINTKHTFAHSVRFNDRSTGQNWMSTNGIWLDSQFDEWTISSNSLYFCFSPLSRLILSINMVEWCISRKE